MKTLYAADPVRYARMTTAEMRENFLLDDLFRAGTIQLVYSDVDRAVVGGAVPTSGTLTLAAADELRAAFFCERRELGVINTGEPGAVTVDDAVFRMENRDGLYIGRGSRSISFSSADAKKPACFYLLSYPAHAAHPTRQARKADAEAVPLGSDEACNKRTIYKYIHPAGIESCQLVMGFTELAEGSVWNTMPPHTHARRMEVYLYFDMDEDNIVFHLMGPADETRHLVVRDREAVLSPSWSLHSGAGIRRYSFVWGMGGENQAFDDMDGIDIRKLL
ncbi:MAG TPA: 5-dehydro-4-deoxy-D-glucuronate isomerase [bacterium]|nr:5-dehydro-4-deoxy-D-glucuronate isomerase [bacterium]